MSGRGKRDVQFCLFCFVKLKIITSCEYSFFLVAFVQRFLSTTHSLQSVMCLTIYFFLFYKQIICSPGYGY